MTKTKGEVLNEGTDYESVQFRSGFFNNFSVSNADIDNDVEFVMECDERIFVHLNQEDIRLLIAHLQKQLR